MNNDLLDTLLRLQQIERHHQQRVDDIWTQYKDAMIVLHGMVFAILGSLATLPILSPESRMALIAFTIGIDLIGLFGHRRDVERSAAAVQADYAAEFRLVTGNEPPRPLYSRAFKMTKRKSLSLGGVTLIAPEQED